MKRWLAAWAVIIGVSAVSCNAEPPHAKAAPACDHRGMDHIQRHGGKAEDDRYHLAHGERVTCDGPDEEKGDRFPQEKHEDREITRAPRHGDEHDDDHNGPLYRDHEGLSCYRLHCG